MKLLRISCRSDGLSDNSFIGFYANRTTYSEVGHVLPAERAALQNSTDKYVKFVSGFC